MSMFQQAAREKIRFKIPKGLVSVEEVWDLPLTSRSGNSLNDLAKSLNRSVKASAEEDFVTKKSADDQILILKFDIVKHIISTKLAEAEAEETAVGTKQKNQKILALIADKQDEELKGKTVEELKAMLVA